MYETSLWRIRGGSFCPEHGGWDQTNGKAMKSLECFSEIIDACIASYAREPEGKCAEVMKSFESFRMAGEALFQMNLKIKSQQKLDPDEFESSIATFLVAFEKAFRTITTTTSSTFLQTMQQSLRDCFIVMVCSALRVMSLIMPWCRKSQFC